MPYELTFAGVPFCLDHLQSMSVETELPDKLKHEGGLDRIWRLLPESYLQEFAPPDHGERRTTNYLAKDRGTHIWPNVRCKVGDWYYPTGACRWSVFKGLAASVQVKEMLRAANSSDEPQTFVMRSEPEYTVRPGGNYTLRSPMYMLPPRPLAEHGGAYDGLYLVTLVDERYYWQQKSASLQPKKTTVWYDFVQQLEDILDINIDTVTQANFVNYTSPELDSQLWSSSESAAMLLDAVAHNTGTVLVRNLDGTYALLTSDESLVIAEGNRKGSTNKIIREGGGEFFLSGAALRVGDTRSARNFVVPATVKVSFPKYVREDTTPHFINPRDESAIWVEDGYGETYEVEVPITSGGPHVSGLDGVGIVTFNESAKAVYQTELVAASGQAPENLSGLRQLAQIVAKDHYTAQVLASQDEVYEGTYRWLPEGLHDIIWTYSNTSKGARVRVMSAEWTLQSRDLQHSTPTVSGFTKSLKGQPGHSIPLTIRDTRVSGELDAGALVVNLASGGFTAQIGAFDDLPEDENWKGVIDGEIILFRGTSGSPNVGIIRRGIDGTVQTSHSGGAFVIPLLPDREFGVNLITFKTPLSVHTGEYTSGGIREAIIKVDAEDLDIKVKVTANDSTTDFLLPKLAAGTGITLTELNDGGYEQVQISAISSPDTDIKVKVTSNDSTTDFLLPKLSAGTGITLTELNDGGYEQVEISAANADIKVKVTSNDTTADFLLPKLSAGTGITLTELNDGANEQVRISANLTAFDIKVKVSQFDTTTDFLINKTGAGNEIVLTRLFPGANEVLLISSYDEKVKVSSNDLLAGYLITKLSAGTNITLVELNDGGNEQLQINATGGGASTFNGARVYNSVPQAIAAGVWTPVEFDSGLFEVGSDYITLPDTDIVIPVTGYYCISGHIQWEGFDLGQSNPILGIRLICTDEDIDIFAQHQQSHPSLAGVGFPTAMSICSACIYLAQGDIVNLEVSQASGADMDLEADIHYSAEIAIFRIGV